MALQKSNGRYTAADYSDIRKDLEALRADVAGLGTNLKNQGVAKACEAMDYIGERLEEAREASGEAMAEVETQIRKKPGQSVAIAFAAGALISFLLGRSSK